MVRLKRVTRRLMVVAAVGVLAACGLDLIATGDRLTEPGGPDGSIDASLPDGFRGDAPGVEGSQIDLPPVPDPFLDAGLDVNQDNCLARCDGGTCDAGWCVLDCAAAGSCTNSPIECPAGIPCDVQCRGAGTCTEGVDCTSASACNINCLGAGSCTNRPVQCSGAACRVDCIGNGNCTKGVNCDAGACTIACLGDGTCTNAPTTCNANTCTIRCGVGGPTGKDSCPLGVKCETTQLCDIGCVADKTCENQPVSARSDGTAIVRCTGPSSCGRGAVLSGAEAGILCSGAGACATKTFCDAGKCSARCEQDDFTFCCKPGSVCERTATACSIKEAGCP